MQDFWSKNNRAKENELKQICKEINEGKLKMTCKQIAERLGTTTAVIKTKKHRSHLITDPRILNPKVLNSTPKIELSLLTKEKKKFRNQEIVKEVKLYLDSAKTIIEKHNSIYKDITLKSAWKKGKQTEDLVLVWSDMHTGMINKSPITGDVTYNEKIQEEELQTLLRGLFRFYQLYKPSYNLETLYIFDVGDQITNDRIYEGQKSEITCGVGEQIIKVLNYQSDFIRETLKIFPKVVMIKEYGNHGRTTSNLIAEEATSNFEYLLGKLLQERFKDNKRVEIIVPEDYYYTVEIRKHKYLLFHGNFIRGATLNTIEKAAQQIALLTGREVYDVIVIGHFHNSLKLRIAPDTILLVNGCFIKHDDFAYNKLRKYSSATQYLFSVSNKSPLHNLQEIYLIWK